MLNFRRDFTNKQICLSFIINLDRLLKKKKSRAIWPCEIKPKNQKQNTDATYDSFANDMWKINCWSFEPSVNSVKNWHCLWFRQSSFHWIISVGVLSRIGGKEIARNIPTPISSSFCLHLRLRLSIFSGSLALLRLMNNLTPILSCVNEPLDTLPHSSLLKNTTLTLQLPDQICNSPYCQP